MAAKNPTPLTDKTIRSLKPRPPRTPKTIAAWKAAVAKWKAGGEVGEKPKPPGPYRRGDRLGLYLLVTPTGRKWWRFDYRWQGTRKTLALGVYDPIDKARHVSLEEARGALALARAQLYGKDRDARTDPMAERKAAKAEAVAQHETEVTTFEKVAREWLAVHGHGKSESYQRLVQRRVEQHLLPAIGARPIAEITVPELSAVLQRIADGESDAGRKRPGGKTPGGVETAHRVRAICAQIYRYAIGKAIPTTNPAQDLQHTLPASKSTNFAHITDPKAIGALLRAIDTYDGSAITKAALRVAPMVFVRPGELQHAEWSEIDFKAGEWRIPGEKMKANRPHIVPLSTQAVALLKELHPVTGAGRYVFPSVRTDTRPMSENTINAALGRLGYRKDEMTPHGFRSLASTRLHELGYPSEWIERQLAHADRDKVRAAYSHAQYLPERRKMMQEWADYLDRLKAGGTVEREGQSAA